MGAKRLALLLALVAASLVALRACGEEAGSEVGVTRELAGRWTTRAEGYSDRFLEILPGEITFGQGEAGETSYPIVGVESSPGPEGRTRYVVRYDLAATVEAEGKLELLLGRSDLRIASQPNIRWTVER